jgi:hypothetical protein
MVEFRCKRSGNVVRFSNPQDIDGLRNHEGYEEVKHETNANPDEAVQIPQTSEKEVLMKRRGRPKKEY